MRIGHIINPYKCEKDNPSYLYIAQPITFKSMLISKRYSEKNNKNLKIDLLTINYEEDDSIIPDYFIKLPYLERSTRDYYETNKKLPFINDILHAPLKYKEDYDYIIYSNSDIALQKHFYIRIYEIINKLKLKSFTINRRDNIPKKVDNYIFTEKDLKILYNFRGLKHPGNDCFIIHKSILEKIDLKDLFIGYSPWGLVLIKILKKICNQFKIFKNEYLTFHIGSDRVWKKDNGILQKQNQKNANIVLKDYNINYEF
jgi:hypothetical protein